MLPREVVDASSLEVIKPRGFEHLGLVEGVPAHCKWGWNQVIFKVLSNPTHSMIL